MCYWLMREEGISAGPSAALNVVGAVKLGLRLAADRSENGSGERPRVATVVCDAAERYASKVLSDTWLAEKGLGVQGAADGKTGLWFLEDTTVTFAPASARE